MTLTSLIIFFLILFLLVVVHEFGHFLFAKLTKMRVDEFAFGFPPRLFSKKVGETLYSFNMIPLGGYVKIYGENGFELEEMDKLTEHDKKRIFSNKPKWARILVLAGGVFFNLLAAAILFAIVLTMGTNIALTPEEVLNTPKEERELMLMFMNDKSPLQETGIQAGAILQEVTVEGKGSIPFEQLTSAKVSQFVQDFNNDLITFKYKDSKDATEIKTISVVPQPGMVEGKKVIGANFADISFKRYPLHIALVEGVKNTYYTTISVITSIGKLAKDLIFGEARIEENVSGPVGLALMTAKISERGLAQILSFAAMLSISLAAFNILPIPALDGGRIIFVLLEAVTGRKISVKIESYFHGLGFLLLISLMVFVTYFDIAKAFVY